jgi:hypothetical protein
MTTERSYSRTRGSNSDLPSYRDEDLERDAARPACADLETVIGLERSGRRRATAELRFPRAKEGWPA